MLTPFLKGNPTSYDYDALLNEAGDPTEKYFIIRNITTQVKLHYLSLNIIFFIKSKILVLT